MVLAVAVWTIPSLAQPQHQPPWWGNDDGRTVSEEYGFDTASSPPNTTATPNPENPPSTIYPEGDAGWIANAGGRQGVMGAQGNGQRGSVVFWVYNGRSDDSTKHLWVQYDSYCDQGTIGGPSAKTGLGRESAGGFNIPNHWEDLGGGWRRCWREWTIKPQPYFEEIKFTFGTAESGGTAVIDNVCIGTHCEGVDDKGDCCAFDLGEAIMPPDPVWVCAWPDHLGTAWTTAGSMPPTWMAELAGHEGVIGMPGGVPADGELTVWIDDLEELEGVKHISCQFDFYVAEGGVIGWDHLTPPGTMVENIQEETLVLEDGWQRCLMTFDVTPPPDWRQFHWIMFTDPSSGPMAIDSLIFSSGTLWADDWFDDFDFYEAGSNLHGQSGWKGWDNDPAVAALVTEEESASPLGAVDVVGGTDLVQEFEGRTSDRWVFTAWQYVPSDFQSGGTGQFAGSYIVMMNSYVDGGPHEDYDWSLQLNFDSNDGMLKVYYGNGLNTVNVPYMPDEWVEIQAVIDLDDDWTQVYYNNAMVAEYSWTGGAMGLGGGALDVAALDLVANGSTSIYYDDVRLAPAFELGDMDCDGSADIFDIDAFVQAITNAAEYEATHPDCHIDNADCNSDRMVDIFDIDAFVAVLVGE